MLAVSDAKYYVPIKTINDDGSVFWVMRRKGVVEEIASEHFKYTIDISAIAPKTARMTFEYNGASVKPAPRTLRMCGAKFVESFTKRLANQTAPGMRFEFETNTPEGKIRITLVSDAI